MIMDDIKRIAEKPLPFILQDGTQVLLRPVVPGDRERIQTGMAALSSETRYFRFFTSATRLSEQELNCFSEVDQQNHIAWIALDASGPNHPGLGIARFIRTKEDPTLAEMAFVVVDAYQHRGLGRMLLAILYLMAEAHGIEVLRADVLGENAKVVDWLRGLGATGTFERGAYRLDLSVHQDRTLLSQTPSAENFRRAIETVQATISTGSGRQKFIENSPEKNAA